MAEPNYNLAGAVASGASAGAGIVPDLSQRIQQLMQTSMQQQGETQREGMRNDTSLMAAGFQRGAGGQMERPTVAASMKDFNEILGQLGPDEDIVIKGPDFQITRKGRKTPSDFDLHKLAVQEAAKTFASYNNPMKPDGTPYTMDEYRDLIFKQYKEYYVNLDQSTKTQGTTPSAAGTGPAKAAVAPATTASPTTYAMPGVVPRSTADAGAGKQIVRQGTLTNGHRVAELADGSIWDLTAKVQIK